MERQGIHELSAAYALHALDPEDERTFEEHLARCGECREHVAAFHETTAAMAYDVEAPQPPTALRERVLTRARSERPNVVALPERRRWVFPATAGLAAAAASAAIALGIWALTLSSNLTDERAALDGSRDVINVLSREDATRIGLSGAEGQLVVEDDGDAWLVVFDLARAPDEMTYEIWVADETETVPAGLFPGGGDHTLVKLERRVPDGASVAVTIERAGGVMQSRNDPVFTSARPT
jgi:anti-sigma-K factor RskA